MMGEQRDRAYGKGARMLLANLAACRVVVIWAIRPPLDRVSRLAVAAGSPPPTPRPAGNPSPDRHAARQEDSVTQEPPASDEQEDPDAILRRALSAAPAEGVPKSDLITVTGMSRRWVFCRLRQLAAEGFAIQTVRGDWRAAR